MSVTGLFTPRACGVCARPEGGEVAISFSDGPSGLCELCTLAGVMAFGLSGTYPFKKMIERVPDVALEERLRQMATCTPRSAEDAAGIARETATLREELALRARLRKD